MISEPFSFACRRNNEGFFSSTTPLPMVGFGFWFKAAQPPPVATVQPDGFPKPPL